MLTRDQAFSFQGMGFSKPVPVDVDALTPSPAEQAQLLWLFSLALFVAPPRAVGGVFLGQGVKPLVFDQPEPLFKQIWQRISAIAELRIEATVQLDNRKDVEATASSAPDVRTVLLRERSLRSVAALSLMVTPDLVRERAMSSHEAMNLDAKARVFGSLGEAMLHIEHYPRPISEDDMDRMRAIMNGDLAEQLAGAKDALMVEMRREQHQAAIAQEDAHGLRELLELVSR